MPKFYIDAGAFRAIIDRPEPKIAAVDAFLKLKDNPTPSINSITIVSEVGFDIENEDDLFISTAELLEQSEQLNQYTDF